MGFKESFKKAFALGDKNEPAISENDIELLGELALVVTRRGLTAPAIFFLESVKPLSFIGSQLMAFFGPLITMVLNKDKFDRIQILFENRKSIDLLIKKIQEADITQSKKK